LSDEVTEADCPASKLGEVGCLARLGEAGLGLNPVGLEVVIGCRGESIAEDLNPPGGGGGRGAGASRLDELARRRETAADPAARGRGHGEHPLIPLHRSRNS